MVDVGRLDSAGLALWVAADRTLVATEERKVNCKIQKTPKDRFARSERLLAQSQPSPQDDPHRPASRQQQVGVPTALQAYATMETRGLIEARPKSGFHGRSRQLDLIPEPRMKIPAAPKIIALGSYDPVESLLADHADSRPVPLGAAMVEPSAMVLRPSLCRSGPAQTHCASFLAGSALTLYSSGPSTAGSGLIGGVTPAARITR